MPKRVNTALKGRRNEHKSIRLLEAAGYHCVRSAASKGAWDIVGLCSTDVVLVQVKTNGWPGTLEVEEMKNCPAPPNCKKLIHRWDDRARQPRVKEVP